MVQSVELLLDDALDAPVRAQWEALAAAGLPSQARHTGATNAPHVTLGVASRMGPVVDAALSRAVSPLPLPLRLGAALVFGGRRRILVRLVVLDAGLLALHTAVAAELDGLPGTDDHLLPGRWTPHVTLARGLTDDQLGPAFAALGPVPDLEGLATRARRWDGDAKQAWDLADYG